MYALESSVRALCRNRQSVLSLEEIEAAAGLADTEIDGRIGQSHYWPKNPDGEWINDPAPSIIRNIANYLTAGTIEMQSYAQFESYVGPNPYGKTLEKRGYQMLDAVVRGEVLVPGLVRFTTGLTRRPAPIHRPVSGLRSSEDRGE
jgi:hypothetical protein